MKDKIKSLSRTYYSRPDVQEAIFQFCKNREVIPRHLDRFGKRPDKLEYPSDILQLAKRGWTSFHCSEELWKDPLKISTDMDKEQLDSLREGWDLLIDIDCKWFDYSKKAALAIMNVLENHSIKNFSIKFSGSKGFHILVPWKAFPKEIGGEKTKNMFPELPRKIVSYIKYEAVKILPSLLPDDFYSQFKKVEIKQGIKCENCKEIATVYRKIKFYCPNCKREEIKKVAEEKKLKKNIKCPDCFSRYEVEDIGEFYECKKCGINSEENPEKFSKREEIDLFELMGLDLVLVSSRHLFRCPYSLHEKGLVSVVLDKDEIENFEPRMADPFRVKIKNFYPEAEEGEAKKLVQAALEWSKEEKKEKKIEKFKEIKIDRRKIILPPSIKKILEGLTDGKKRALFILINYFKCLGFDFDEIEKKISEWNEKNNPKLKEGYIKAQLFWHQRQEKILPPNYDKDYYRGIGIIPTDEELRYKNPVNYTIKMTRKRKKWKE